MSEITVTIRQRPLGIRFGHFYNSKKKMVIGIHEVQPVSHGQQLGLLPGDILKTLNGSNVYLLQSSKALEYFRKQPLPFIATFVRQSENNSDNSNDDFKDATDEIWISHINTHSHISLTDNTPLTSAENTPIGINSYLSTGNSNHNSPMFDSNSSISLSFSDTNTYSYNHSSKSANHNSLVDIKNSYSYHKHNQNRSTDFLCPKGGRIMYELAEKLLCQASHYKAPIPTPQLNDFVFIDENYDKQIEYNSLCQYYRDIDIDTKYLTNGYLRNLTKYRASSGEYEFCDFIRMLISKYLWCNVVSFDNRSEKHCSDVENTKVCSTSSNGFKYGIHEWTIQILKSDIHRQEIGVIERNDKLNDICIKQGGIGKTNSFGARAVYGNVLGENKCYYSSYNDNDQPRCRKSINQKIGWCTNDLIKVVLNLKRSNIQFFLNGAKVRKTLSLQKNKIYHPIVSFSGNCQYELNDYS